jgi:8-oxo-dGTP pyrophosphatase MutT (NUDIX family)
MGNILLNVSTEHWKQLLHEVNQLPLHKVASISLLLAETADIDSLLQQYFKLTHSAGGIVRQGASVLMIYRSHMWDLPKGTVEPGETPTIAAIREVQEECGVQASVQREFFTTWHAFQLNHTRLLKKTTWYIMDCIEDKYMAPQQEEAIEQVTWVPLAKLPHMLKNTYASIQMLLQAYQNYWMLQQSTKRCPFNTPH